MGICGSETNVNKRKTGVNNNNSEKEKNNTLYSRNNGKIPMNKTETQTNNFNITYNKNIYNPPTSDPIISSPITKTNVKDPLIQPNNTEVDQKEKINEQKIKESQIEENNQYPNIDDLNQNKNISEQKELNSVVPTNNTIEKENPNLEELIENEREKEKEILIINQNKITKYDAIYSCESLKALFDKGWNYTLFDSFIKRLQMNEDDRCFCPLCMIGETNKGKTFILNLLTNNKLESGIQYRTEGISCKFTSFNEDNEEEEEIDKKFLLFDTAGRSEPLLIDPEIKKKFTEEDFKRTVETNNRDLKLSEDFMKNLLIKNSKIIIVVVNQLSLAEQLFLFELKNEENYKQLFVIHNIFNFKQREEMENYIENTIINSIYFDLSKHYFDNYDEKQNDTDRPFYFTEELEKNGRQQAIITHLILGDIESKVPWIKNFNEQTLSFLKSNMRTVEAKDFFDIGII